jgi:hypothetical protein
MSGLTANEQGIIAAVVGRNAAQTKWNSYYSKVRFNTTLASLTYTVAQGQTVTAFGYGIGQDMAAGGRAGNPATPADTNITAANQTISGESVLIRGIGLLLMSGSDAHLAKQSDGQISVIASLNGGNPTYKLGIPTMLPGPGGFYGRSEAASVGPSPAEVVNGNIGALSNGLPSASNYFPFEEPIIWRSAGKPDSAFNVQLRAEYAFSTNVNYAIASRAAIAAVASSFVGVNVYNAPSAAATYLEFMVELVGCTFNELSSN